MWLWFQIKFVDGYLEYWTTLEWMQYLVDGKSALVKVMAWCGQGIKPLPAPGLIKIRSLMPYAIIRPQWVSKCQFFLDFVTNTAAAAGLTPLGARSSASAVMIKFSSHIHTRPTLKGLSWCYLYHYKGIVCCHAKCMVWLSEAFLILTSCLVISNQQNNAFHSLSPSSIYIHQLLSSLL